MSRAFVKDDAPDEPALVPPRAPLPAGIPNYVTPRGMALLRAERTELETERAHLQAARMDATDRSRALSVNARRSADLQERISSAKLVAPRTPPLAEARFGARVTVRVAEEDRVFTIVGVDEADADAGYVAFTSPVAQALTGHVAGDRTTLVTPSGVEPLIVLDVAYGVE